MPTLFFLGQDILYILVKEAVTHVWSGGRQSAQREQIVFSPVNFVFSHPNTVRLIRTESGRASTKPGCQEAAVVSQEKRMCFCAGLKDPCD